MGQDTWKPSSFAPEWKPKSFSVDAEVEPEEESVFKKLGKGGLADSSIPLSDRIKTLFTGTDKDMHGRPILGPGLAKVPGTDTAVHKIDDIINPPSEHPGVVRPFISGVLGGLLDSASSGLADARFAVPMHTKLPDIAPPEPKAPLALPPAPDEIANAKPTTFYNGPAGTTQADKLYPMDTAPLNPRLGQTTQPVGKGNLPVTILPHETEGLSNLDPITAANRGTRLGDIQSLDKETPDGIIRTLNKVKDGEPMKMPVRDNEIGDIGVPNERKQSDSFTPTELPEPNARPFGSTKNKATGSWDTVGQGKTEPQTFVPDTPESSVNIPSDKGNKVDTANLSQKDNSTGVPTPGQAVSKAPKPVPVSTGSKDINSFRAEFGSVDQTLASRPESAPIAKAIVGAADQKAQWIATTERLLADHTSGLDKGELVKLGDMVDKGIKPGDSPILAQKATAIKEVLDQIHADLKIPTSITDGPMGYIETYLSHIDKLPEDDLKTGIKQVWEYHVGKPFKDLFQSNPLAKGGEGLGDMYERGLGNPDSPFRKTRGVGLDNIELNVNKVLPAYVESIARLKFDRPAVDAAKQALMSMPEKDIYGEPSKLRELATWYIKNYTRYDSMPGLSQGWNDWTNKLMRTTGRSMLGFSTGLQTLHLARIPANLYPELGEKYMVAGIKAVTANPAAAYREAATMGLLQNEVRPWNFKTPMQKADSILSFFSGADFLDRSIGYHGFKTKYLAEGMDETAATAAALAKSKQASLIVDSARPIKSFNPTGSPIADSAWRLSTQFKQVPVKIIEQYIQIASKARQDPKAAARMVAGVGVAYGAMEAGLHTFHLSPTQFAMQMGGAVATVGYSVYKDLAKGDIVSALKKTAVWLTPGGMSIERQLRKGLSAFENN